MMSNTETAGVSRWRQVVDGVMDDIIREQMGPGVKLPSEVDLAARFGVARHTVRRAVSHLQNEGVLQAEHGRGTFVTKKALEYRVSANTWFEQNLFENAATPIRSLIAMYPATPSAKIADRLRIDGTRKVLTLILLGLSGDTPINIGYNYFPTERMPSLENLALGSSDNNLSFPPVAKLLELAGVSSFRRTEMRIRGRLATESERIHLNISADGMILETEVVACDPESNPVLYAVSAYAAKHVEFYIGREMFQISATDSRPE